MLKPYNKAEINFDLLEEIGQEGKNSKTFKALDHQLNAEIVIKKLDKSKLDSPDVFFSEAKALYASSHPNVVQIHYACADANNIYIALPFYKNASVKQLMATRNLTVREIVKIGCQIISGLHNIHSKGLIHFDIKPDNVLISDRGEALVSDFGLAKQMTYGKAEQDRIYGKMIPPEALIGVGEYTLKFDIYQLGLTLYRMCNGDKDFYAQFEQFINTDGTLNRDNFKFAVRNGRFPERGKFAHHIPQKLRRVIKKCLEIDLENRYSSALDVANDLADIDGETLDWIHTKLENGLAWSKTVDETTHRLTLFNDGRSEFIKVTTGGKPRKVNEGCKERCLPSDVTRLLGAY
jgi:eukaryotic-like serine/threonine-protein kinase